MRRGGFEPRLIAVLQARAKEARRSLPEPAMGTGDEERRGYRTTGRTRDGSPRRPTNPPRRRSTDERAGGRSPRGALGRRGVVQAPRTDHQAPGELGSPIREREAGTGLQQGRVPVGCGRVAWSRRFENIANTARGCRSGVRRIGNRRASSEGSRNVNRVAGFGAGVGYLPGRGCCW